MYEKKKLLLIMRHAKSDRTQPFVIDFDRPLNDRGQHQPKDIAKQLNDLNVVADKVLVSPAQRTRETWNLLQTHLKHEKKPIFVQSLYQSESEDFIQVLMHHADNCHRLLVIAHNPTVTEVTEYLTGEYHDFKTASLCIMSSEADLLESLRKPAGFHFEKMIEAKH